jgi:glycosyltransferase 2 family protein
VARKLWRVLQLLAGVLLVGLALRSIVLNWQSVRAQPVEWQVSPLWLLASVGVVFIGYGILIEAWRRVVLSLGERLNFGSAARIWFLASLGKYIPGKVWSIAGAAILARRAGVDPSAAVAGAIVLQALALASGAAVIALTAGETFQAIGPELVALTAAVVIACIAGVGLLTSQASLDWLARRLPASFPRPRAIRPGVLSAAFAANVVAWIAYGTALLFLARGVLPDVSLSLAHATGVFTCSYIAGFVALFAPGGLGPRESVFYLMLADEIGLKQAAGLAVASRLLLTGTELLPALPLLLRRNPSWSTRDA